MNRRTPSSGATAHRHSGRHAARGAQRGIALAISLVLLVAMTVVGIATLSGTRLNEKITANAQQKSVAFEVAESAIDTVWSGEAIVASIAEIPAEDFDEPPAIPPADAAAELSTSFDQRLGAHESVDIAGSVTIRYCGESPLPEGTGLNADESAVRLVGTLFDVDAVATIAGSATRSEHVQRGSLTRPATGRRGGCTVPESP